MEPSKGKKDWRFQIAFTELQQKNREQATNDKRILSREIYKKWNYIDFYTNKTFYVDLWISINILYFIVKIVM